MSCQYNIMIRLVKLLWSMQGAPFESELEYLAYECQGDPLVQTAVLSFKEQTALQVTAAQKQDKFAYCLRPGFRVCRS